MKMQVFHESIEGLLSEPEERRDSFWAYKVCQQTRLVVHKMFECWPDASEVQGLLDILQDQPEEVRNAKKAGPYADRLGDFADSMELRLDELRAYIAEMGLPVAVAEPNEDEPDDHE